MNTRTQTYILSALMAVGLAACDGESSGPTDSPRAADASAMKGTLVEIIPSAELPETEVHAIAQELERVSGASRAKVMLRKDDRGGTHLEVELWGDAPVDPAVIEGLRERFASLEGAQITHAAVDGPPADGGPIAVEADADLPPAELKAKIEADLRAQGVDGDITVDVVEGEGQREVEVRVEKREDISE